MNRFWSQSVPNSNAFPRAPTDRTRRRRFELDCVNSSPGLPPWIRRSRNSTFRLFWISMAVPLELVNTLPPATSLVLPWTTR